MNISTQNRLSERLIKIWTAGIILFLYLPIVAIILASFSRNRYFSFPIKRWTLKWYENVLESLTIRDLLVTSFSVAGVVTIVSVVLAFFGALAFARYRWAGRTNFQRLILLPIFFPQAVLGLAMLLWMTALGIEPSWQTAAIAHMVWIVPIVTLIISIGVYGFDPALEDAAFDLGASRWQVMREVTLPILAPGIVSGAIFAFLLSWGNFPLSVFTTGVDSTIPEWLYGKMIAGYTPMVPALGAIMVYIIIIPTVSFFVYKVWRQRRIDRSRE